MLLTGTARSPRISDIGRVELCDPRFPETLQPHHAAMGKLETDSIKVNQRKHVVRNIAHESLTKLIKDYQQQEFRIKCATLVVGSQIDPTTIPNPHIRAHALEGRLFHLVLEECLRHHNIHTDVLLERDAYACVAAGLKQSADNLKRLIQDLGQSAPAKHGPWRSEQKLAALAALFVLG